MAEILTTENLRITREVLEEIDRRSGHIWMANHEKPLRKDNPHSDSQVFGTAKGVLDKFFMTAPAGSAQGLAMLTSAFENLLRFIGKQ